MSIQAQWDKESVKQLFELPFVELIHRAQTVHHQHFNKNELQISNLLSIKTGACPEDCGYCSQSGHHDAKLLKQKLLDINEVISKAQEAKASGATRFCMGAAWRNPPEREFPKVLAMIKAVKDLGMETCVTLGMLSEQQANQLHEVGLDYYNHNLDTSPEYYKKITTTRCYQDRLDTLEKVRNAGIKVCCGGIIGMGETREDRIELLLQLANLPEPPESLPINRLIPIPGTPLANVERIDNFEFIRTIAVARIMFPQTVVRLSAGRKEMSEEMHALCFMAGANSMFLGPLLTTPNPENDEDSRLLKKLGMVSQKLEQNEQVTS